MWWRNRPPPPAEKDISRFGCYILLDSGIRGRTFCTHLHKAMVKGYEQMLADVAGLLEEARRAAPRTVNTLMTATYWAVGQRIFQHEQAGQERAGYGEQLLKRLSRDLRRRFGRGFSLTNLKQFRRFYLVWHNPNKGQTASDQLLRMAGDKGQMAVWPIRPGQQGVAQGRWRPARIPVDLVPLRPPDVDT